MAGFSTKNRAVTQKFQSSFTGADGSAAPTDQVTLLVGFHIPFPTGDAQVESPRDVDVRNGTLRQTAGAIAAPRLIYHPGIASITGAAVRFSGTIFTNAGGDGALFFLGDPAIGTADNGTGYIQEDQAGSRIVFGWGASTATTSFTFQNPGSDTFRWAIEIADGVVRGYYYKFLTPNSLSLDEVHQDQLIQIGAIAFGSPNRLIVGPGWSSSNTGEDVQDFMTEVMGTSESGGLGPGAPIPFSDYGLFKSQLTIHGLLNNALPGTG